MMFLRQPALPFALVAGAIAFAFVVFPSDLLNESDTYWHIKAGEWMLKQGEILRTDPFSSTMNGKAWHTQEWLAEILMAASYRFGWESIHLIFGICVASAAAITAFFIRRRVDLFLATLITTLGLACTTGSLLARPHLFTLPLLALWTMGLVKAREAGHTPPLYMCLIMPIWANLHGSFVFALGLAGLIAAEAFIENYKSVRDWAIFIILASALCLLTPFGLEGVLFPFKLMTITNLNFIVEWQPSDFSEVSPFALSLLALIGLLGLGKVAIPVPRLLIVLLLMWMALNHARHQMIFGLVVPLLITPAIAQVWPAQFSQAMRHHGLKLFVLAIAFVSMITARLALPIERTDNFASPMTALSHISDEMRGQNVLNDFAYGGYLIWIGIKPSIDSRSDLYNGERMETYLAMVNSDQQALDHIIQQYDMRWAIFPASSPVIKMLDQMKGWSRYYEDDQNVIHIRKDKP